MKNLLTRCIMPVLFLTIICIFTLKSYLYSAKYMRVYYIDWNTSCVDPDSTVDSYYKGDSMYIEMPGDDRILGTSDDKNMVIDGGNTDDISKTRWDEFLTAKSISKINYMFVSHPHGDHINGLPLIADMAKVEYLYANKDYSVVTAFSTLKAKVLSAGGHLVFVTRGDILSSTFTATYAINTHPWNGPAPYGWDPNVSAIVIASTEDAVDRSYGYDYNAQSLMFTLRFGSSSFIFGGDSKYNISSYPTDYGEGYAIANYPAELKVDILKADHHGDYDTYTTNWYYNSINFLNLVMPKWCITQDGGIPSLNPDPKHPLGLPNLKTLINLKSRGAKVYRNDLDGHVLVKCDDAGNYDIVRETVRYDDDPHNGKVSGSWLSNVPALPNDLRFFQMYQSSVTLIWSAVARHIGSIVGYDVYMANYSNGDPGAGIGAAGGFTPTQKAEPYLTGIYQKLNSTDIAGKEAGDNMFYTVTGLALGATNYFFRVVSVGTSHYYEHRYSNEADGIPPGKIVSMSGSPNLQTAGSVTLTWSVPAGNDNVNNFSGIFYIQNTNSLSDALSSNFWSPGRAQDQSAEVKDLTPGSDYSMTLYRLTPGVTYYLRTWARDQSFNYSAMSIGVTTYASPPLTPDNVYAYPNPLIADFVKSITFKNLTKYAKIDIFNISGELVFEAEKNDFSDKYVWDINNNSGNQIASGTYIFAVTDVAGRQKTGKFQIIR